MYTNGYLLSIAIIQRTQYFISYGKFLCQWLLGNGTVSHGHSKAVAKLAGRFFAYKRWSFLYIILVIFEHAWALVDNKTCSDPLLSRYLYNMQHR